MNYKFFFIVLILISFSSIVSSLSEQATNVSAKIEEVSNLTNQMIERGIPIQRINESLQEAKQIYFGQLALELSSKKHDYSIVLERTSDMISIIKVAFKAFDEFKVFNETYYEASKEIDLSEMQEDYLKIVRSFNEERFEDTLVLIDTGYAKLSETQSKQTNLNLFYSITSRTIKNFLINNWLKLLIIFSIILTLLMIFRKVIARYIVHLKLNELTHRKNVLIELIKKLQYDYFEKNTISEEEYRMKLNKFTEMLRDIAREVPLLKEEVMKLADNKKDVSPEKLLDVIKNIQNKSVKINKKMREKKRRK